jgi:hypothetical protein
VPGEVARARPIFYRQLIDSAHFFADQACDLETHPPSGSREDLLGNYRTYVLGTVLSAVGFLEASINALYLEMQDMGPPEQPQLPNRLLALSAQFWPQVQRSPILHKYQVALLIADAERFDELRAPFHDADSLIKLRDALVLGGPDWTDGRARHPRLERQLRHLFPPIRWFRRAGRGFRTGA